MMDESKMNSEGEFRIFDSGAVRDTANKKPMLHLISPFFLEDLGEWLRFACQDRKPEPYPPRNWEKGMPFSETLGSGFRHLKAIMAGDESEDHIAAFGFAAMALAHYRHEIKAGRMDPALDDMPKYEQMACPACGRGPVQPDQCPETGVEYSCPVCGWTSLDAPKPGDFCRTCGASVPHRMGEGTCSKCDPKGTSKGTPCANYVTRMKCEEPFYPVYSNTHVPEDPEALAKAKPIVELKGTIYIAGPMRGLPLYNFPLFDYARDRWNSWHYAVISPADLDRATGFDPTVDPEAVWDCDKGEVIKRDILAIIGNLKPNGYDAIALLPGWENSKGAAVEIALGRFLGLEFVDALTGKWLEV